MNNRNLININPKVLSWARTEMGTELVDMAFLLDIDHRIYNLWETDGKDVPFTKLKEISKLFKRQISCFFLPRAPKSVKKPKDHRNLKSCAENLSKDTLLAIRNTCRYQELLLNLNTQSYYETKYKWLSDFHKEFEDRSNIGNELIANWIRKRIGLSLEKQTKCRDPYGAYKLWRNLIEENLGISIFQFKMPIDEIQGFCYGEEFPYCITVNSVHSAPTGKIFTILHELAHIIKHQSSICYPDRISESQKLEFECNSFAGKVLMPKESIVPTFNSDDIYKKARKLNVSSEAYLRRMHSLKIVSDKDFFILLEEIRSKVKTKKGFAIISQLQKSMNSRGNHLFNTVVDAAKGNKISYSNASDVLGIKINHFVNL